jgi:hypothetical protein
VAIKLERMEDMSEIGYINYLVSLFIVTGFLLLRVDTPLYKNGSMEREKKFAKFLGWSNIALGLIIFVGNWLYENFLW